jgi:GntR family transcriptional repressor for pyruvate dehydrogenase complex
LPAVKPILRRKVSDDVASQLESMLRDGTLTAGEALPAERDLMRTFGVGRPAVREALFRLKRMGLVELRNGERARVTRPTPRVLLEELSGAARLLLAQPRGNEHFQQARALFEIGVAEQAARMRRARDVVSLRTALAANEAAIGDPERFERTDVAFHYELARITGNPIFVAIHDSIVEWLTEQRTVALRVPGADRLACNGHRRIFNAVEKGAPGAATAAMRRHLREVAALYWTSQGSADRRG